MDIINVTILCYWLVPRHFLPMWHWIHQSKQLFYRKTATTKSRVLCVLYSRQQQQQQLQRPEQNSRFTTFHLRRVGIKFRSESVSVHDVTWADRPNLEVN